MAITTSNPCGVVITTSAWCGVVVSSTSNTVTVNGRWALGANQNNGNVACAFNSFVDRNILINRGACEQERYVTAVCECACNDRTTITVHEPWCTNPTACQNVDSSYIIQDAATVTGLGLINKRVQDYTSTRHFHVGTGCGFAYFALLNGASLETVDRSSITCPDFEVNNQATFSNGFIANGTGAGGGYIIGTPATIGELAFEAQNGSRLKFNDPLFFTNVNNPSIRILGACTTGIVKMKNVFGTNTFNISSPCVVYDCLNIVGKNHANDSFNFTGAISGQTYTITNLEIDSAPIQNTWSCITNPGTRTVNIINLNVKREWACNIIYKEVQVGGGFTGTTNVINPRWCATASKFTLIGSGSVISEQFRQNITVQNGCCKVSGSIVNHISTRSGTAAIRITTSSNACGIATADTESNRWTGISETLATSTAHGLQVHNYAETSFASVPTLDNTSLNINGQNLTVAVTTDPFVVETTEATALADGTTAPSIDIGTNPHSIIKYTAGTCTLTVGKWVGVCNGACAPTIYGRVKEIIEGNSSAGTVVLHDRSTGAFTTSLVEYECSACAPSATKLDWTGSLTACSQKCFDYLYCVGEVTVCNPRTIQQAYDHSKAKLHQCPIDTADNWDDVKIWAVGEHSNFLQGVDSNASPKTFQTVRNVANTAGWVITGALGYGPITGFTSNDGTVFTFASTVPVQIRVLEAEDFVTPVVCARVNVQNAACPADIILNTTTNACGIAQICYPTPSCPINVIVRARKEVEDYVKQPGTISPSSGLSLTIGVKDDPNYTPT